MKWSKTRYQELCNRKNLTNEKFIVGGLFWRLAKFDWCAGLFTYENKAAIEQILGFRSEHFPVCIDLMMRRTRQDPWANVEGRLSISEIGWSENRVSLLTGWGNS